MVNRLLMGKRALITGGAHGIGRAIALEFLAQGSKVVIIDRDATAAAELAQEVGDNDDFGYDIVDLADRNRTDGVMRDVLRDGPLDVLVSNAGVDYHTDFTTASPEEWRKLMEINFFAAQHVARQALKGMSSGGSIMFITSVHTAHGFQRRGAYDASKHALVGLMRSLAVDLGPKGIRVNAVAPGAIYPTGITKDNTPAQLDKVNRCVPLGRSGRPQEVAQLCAFLASDLAPYIHGEEIRIDGGLSIISPLETK